MNRYKVLLLTAGLALLSTSCNSFLDTPPDKRPELDDPTTEQLHALLTSAYCEVSTEELTEGRTDNAMDNGGTYSAPSELRENYYWEPNTGTWWGSTQRLWSASFNAISAANFALELIEKNGNKPEYNSAKGEALLCRAWNHFVMLGIFSHAYNGQTSSTDLGIPYFTAAEKNVTTEYKRLSVKECFDLMEQDIEAGLPLIDETKYKTGTVMYHFNNKAAHAFAAQFYLYKEDWAKAKKHATLAIGENPSASLRDVARYAKTTNGAEELTNAYNSTAEPANLMLQTSNTNWGRYYVGYNYALRYANNRYINTTQTYASPGPWGSSLPSLEKLVVSYTSASDALFFIQKNHEYFVLANATAGTGQPYTVARPFTVDRTLFVRAEANVMLGLYEEAARDLSYWYVRNGARAVSADVIAAFYALPEVTGRELTKDEKTRRDMLLSTYAKALNPKFALQPGMQYNMIQAVLHARRIDGVHEGTRWDDIKRYGIEIEHPIFEGEVMKLGKDDPRRAIQLPADIIAAGLQANPREAGKP